MVGGFPVRMLVGGAETRHPERRCISECSTEVGGGGPIARCHCEGIDDFGRIIAEKALRHRDVIRPMTRFGAGRKEVRQLGAGSLAQGDEVDGLAPRCPFLGTPSCCHLANHARQHIGRCREGPGLHKRRLGPATPLFDRLSGEKVGPNRQLIRVSRSPRLGRSS